MLDYEKFEQECVLVFNHDAANVVLFADLEGQRGEVGLEYSSCDFHQGRVRLPLIRSKSTNPEVGRAAWRFESIVRAVGGEALSRHHADFLSFLWGAGFFCAM